MTKQKQLSGTEIKKLISTDKLIIGTDRTVKQLKVGKIDTVLMSSNCDKKTVEDIEHYGSLSGANVIHTQFPNDELGILCKKTFPIAVLSIPKGAN